jgi:hypothetical protein
MKMVQGDLFAGVEHEALVPVKGQRCTECDRPLRGYDARASGIGIACAAKIGRKVHREKALEAEEAPAEG